MLDLLIGVIFVLLAVGGIFFVKRRSFYRRNMAGVEEFESFSSVVLNRGLEKILSILSVVFFMMGVLLIISGLVGK